MLMCRVTIMRGLRFHLYRWQGFQRLIAIGEGCVRCAVVFNVLRKRSRVCFCALRPQRSALFVCVQTIGSGCFFFFYIGILDPTACPV